MAWRGRASIFVWVESLHSHPSLTSLPLQGYEEATERAVRTLLELAEPSDGWRLNFERQGVRAYKRVVQEDDRDEGASRRPRHGSFSTLKGQGIIRHHPIAVLLAVMDNTIGRQLDPQVGGGGRRMRVARHNIRTDLTSGRRLSPIPLHCTPVRLWPPRAHLQPAQLPRLPEVQGTEGKKAPDSQTKHPPPLT